jgi:sugar (glycoside-pentoside-hexuronide) transporter
MENNSLDRKTLICYSLGNITQISMFMFIGFYIMEFYTDVIHLSSHLVGYALLIAYILSAITNVAMGYVSDHTRWRIGRRRPYFLIGTIPSGILFFFVFAPPMLSQNWLFAYLTITASLLLIAIAIFETPYNALAPELTYDYNERIRLSGYRRSLELCGEILGIFTLPLMLALKGNMSATAGLAEAGCYRLVAFLISVSAIVAGIFCYWGTWERQQNASRASYHYGEALRSAIHNKPFVLIVVAFTLTVIADNITLSQLLYIIESFLHKKKEDMATFMFVFFLGSLASVPLWMKIGKLLGKKACYMVAMFLYPLPFCILAAHVWPDVALFVTAFFGGALNAGLYMMPVALMPDIVEWDELQTHQRREGTYMGIWIFCYKLGLGLSFLAVGISLEFIGYDSQHLTTEIIDKLRRNFVILPTIIIGIAVLLFSFFPISKAKHEEILKQLNERHSKGEGLVW